MKEQSYQKLAEHYGFLISPCLPRKANHKGGVENDIKYVKKNFWPLFKEDQRVRGYTDLDACELKRALCRWHSRSRRPWPRSRGRCRPRSGRRRPDWWR